MAFGVPNKFKSLPKEDEAVTIIMRKPEEGDEAIVANGISRGDVNVWTNTNRSITAEMEKDFFKNQAEDKNSVFWIIAIAEDENDNIGRPIGVTSIGDIKDRRGGSGCIIFDTSLWGKGIASACHRVRCFIAFSRLNLRAIDSAVVYGNEGSLKALLGVGYASTGTIYGGHFNNGTWHHLHTLTWVNPNKDVWNEFWRESEPPAEFVEARKKSELALEWAKENVTFL